MKATKFAAAGLAWLMSFTLAEVTTGQAVVAAFFAFVSAAIAAWLASRPALIQARNQREQQHVTEAAAVDARQERVHAVEIQWLQSQITYSSQALVLTRQSKHALLNYAQSLGAHAHQLEQQLRDAGRPVCEFQYKFYDELCGEEDRALAMLTLPTPPPPGSQSGEHQR